MQSSDDDGGGGGGGGAASWSGRQAGGAPVQTH